MIKIHQETCIGCGKCVNDCPSLNLRLENGKAEVKENCLMCGHCYAVCPVGAVEMPDEYLTEDEELCDGKTPALDPEIFLHSIKCRRSIRQYQETPVEQNVLEKLLQAGRYTATAKNNQECHFVFVQQEREFLKEQVWNYIEEKIKEYGTEIPENYRPYASFSERRKKNPSDDYLFRNSPVIVFIASDWPLDAGLAAQNMEMMAVSLGLGVLYNGYLARIAEENKALKDWMGIGNVTIKACLLIGYPAIKYHRSAPRKKARVFWK